MHRSKLGLASMLAVMAAASSGVSVPITGGGFATLKASSDSAFNVTKSTGNQSKKSGTKSSDFVVGAWLRLRGTRQRRAAYGWTNAHQKRVARKARNVKRSRRK